MHLVWHIFKKDACLMRVPLAAWISMQLLTLLAAALIAGSMDAAAPGFAVWLGGAHILLVTVGWLSAYFFAAIPLHEDAVDGGDALWRTLPVSRLQLFGAKLLGLVVFFGVLPILLRLPWWLFHGFNAREIFLAAIETAQTSAAVIALALALASVTNTAEQFYRWTLGAAGLAVVAALSFLLTRTGISRVSPFGDVLDQALMWRALATALTVSLTLAAISQFFAPNRLRTALLVVMFITAGVFFGTFPVGPYAPRVKVELSAVATVENNLTGKISITEKSSSSQAFITLTKSPSIFAPTYLGRIFVDGEITSLSAAAGYFAQLPQQTGPATIYGFYSEDRAKVGNAEQATFLAEGSIWEPESILSVPLVAGAEVVKGSRRLRVEHFVLGRPDGDTPQEIRGQLVLGERLPVLAAEEKYRPRGFSEFYVLVTPSGWKRIMFDSDDRFVSANVGMGADIFPISESDLGRLPDGSAAPASSVRVVKVGLRRLGVFKGKIPVTLGTPKP